MKAYKISFKSITVTAKNEKEAEKKVLENLDKLEIAYIDEEEII